MSFFGGSSASSTDASGLTPEQRKQQIMQQVRTELALANAQELINKIGDNCFTKCITKPSTKLDSSEETCLAKCMDRYMDAWNIVSRAYVTRIQREVPNDMTGL
ncbi:hypothetical protein AMAG_03091 [Allomyces macrogynus ATCC 38327]|uniref:Mitochondrial import inner membrane translocase subunit n=1 Tax=Allomyces macrogynus (strain ATCC 38327) TaxID=578462 RepID=A0A0L0S4J6_ALLM3|nr:hypothetical protein AMAG_03091 [Allomyces macrogynus ATCC 38327]|eukprot:KNE57370.1 hypothetical protein AMAG_03091 [Allomyces macrogynus ATCC 38327]